MRIRWLLWGVLGLVASLTLLVLTRVLWLPWIAQRLVVEDQLTAAELIFVYAGEYRERARHAAVLYQQGLAPRLLVTGEGISRDIAYFCDRQVSKADLTARVLIESGVPADAIDVVPQGTSTFEESETLRGFLQARGWHSVIVVSSPYHMRRIRATLRHVLPGNSIAVQYSPANPSSFRVQGWWRRERDLLRVSSEYLKMAYYYLVLF